MRFLVIGAAGHAEEVAWALREQERVRGRSSRISFFDDRVPQGPLRSGLGSVEGTLDDVERYARGDDVWAVLGLGLPRTKASLVDRLAPLGVRWATVVHPGAVIGPNVSLGDGSYVAAGAVLTVNVRVGRFVTVNAHSHVAHGAVVGDFVSLHPDVHVSGEACIGEGAELGVGTIVLPGTTVGPWAVVGAGAVAVRTLIGGKTYVGVPAREVDRERHPRRVAAAGSERGSAR